VLLDYVAEDFKKVHGLDPRDSPRALQDLVLECESAKRRLGRLSTTTIRVQMAGRDHLVEIRRDAFEEQTEHLLRATKLTTELALEDAKLTWEQVSRVVLVGGATHMPAVRRMIQQMSGKPPDTGVNPVLAVGLGAAIYAHMLETGHMTKAIKQKAESEPLRQPPPMPSQTVDRYVPPTIPMPAESIPTVRFVTAHGVGLKVRSHLGWINRVLIPKNTAVPASVTKRFLTKATGKGGTEIKIELTQGDTTDLSAAETLGTGRISGLPSDEPDGQPVDVTMRFNEQGRLKVYALYVPRRQKMEITLEIPGGLRQEDVAAHRQYLEDTGFLSPVEGRKLVEGLEDEAGEETIEPQGFDEIFSAEDLMQALESLNEDQDLPMIEPVD
jgi:molecular chaperone DnaK